MSKIFTLAALTSFLGVACLGGSSGIEFRAESAQAADYRISDVSLRAYDGLSLSLKIGSQKMESMTPVGGIIITANLENLSGDRMFIPAYGVGTPFLSGEKLALFSRDGSDSVSPVFVAIEGTDLQINAGLAGYFIDVDETSVIKFASTDFVADELKVLLLEIKWRENLIDEPTIADQAFTFEFVKSGSGSAGSHSESWSYPFLRQ